ncbi:hypothetical protein [Victivallis vadensis]|uniref:hypothetical protein n=1 Tax=Victivallis vadensis TaxID=172901 RepID=UPI003CFEA923
MKIRIYETDFEGHPVECTGEFFSGPSAIAIVEAMKMSPFTASLDPLAFMRRVLDGIGQADFELTGPPEKAAIVFLQRLTALNFAGYELEEDEVIFAPVSGHIREMSKKQVEK